MCDPKKNYGEYLAYGTTDKPSFGNYGNIFENMNHPSVTGSKILTKTEPDRIGIILAGTNTDYKPEKVNGIQPDWPNFYWI